MGKPLAGREDGFTIIEVLVAALILVLGSLAVFMVFASAIHNVQRGRESQIGISVAQREMERVRVIPFDSVGLAPPTPAPLADPTPDPNDPNSRLATIGGSLRFNLARSGPSDYRNLVTAGEVTPVTPEVRSSDGTEVTVYRFIVCEEEDCRSKRIVIDVVPTPKANLANYKHSYYELQSTVVEPETLP